MFVHHSMWPSTSLGTFKDREGKKNHCSLQGAYNQHIHKQDFDSMIRGTKPEEELNLNLRKSIIH